MSIKTVALMGVFALSAVAAAVEVKVDFAKETGPVKPVNGVGQPPMLGFGGDSLFHYLTEAGVPFSRLHDTGGAFGKSDSGIGNSPVRTARTLAAGSFRMHSSRLDENRKSSSSRRPFRA